MAYRKSKTVEIETYLRIVSPETFDDSGYSDCIDNNPREQLYEYASLIADVEERNRFIQILNQASAQPDDDSFLDDVQDYVSSVRKMDT